MAFLPVVVGQMEGMAGHHLAAIPHALRPHRTRRGTRGQDTRPPLLRLVDLRQRLAIGSARRGDRIEVAACRQRILTPGACCLAGLEVQPARINGGGYLGPGPELLAEKLKMPPMDIASVGRHGLVQPPRTDHRALGRPPHRLVVFDPADRVTEGRVIGQYQAVIMNRLVRRGRGLFSAPLVGPDPGFAMPPIVANALLGAQAQEKVQIGFVVLGAVSPVGYRVMHFKIGAAHRHQQLLDDVQSSLVLKDARAFDQTQPGQARLQNHLVMLKPLVPIDFAGLPDDAVVVPQRIIRQARLGPNLPPQQFIQSDFPTPLGDQLQGEFKAVSQPLPARETGGQHRVLR